MRTLPTKSPFLAVPITWNGSIPMPPRVDWQNGDFSGYVWSANTGWINLGTGILKIEGSNDLCQTQP